MKTTPKPGTIKTLTMHYIDGAFVESHGKEVMDVIRPTDGQIIARATLGDEEDTRRAIAAARRAFTTYSRSAKEERGAILRRLHKAASARIDDLTAAMVEEYGGVSSGREGAPGDRDDSELGQDDGDIGACWCGWFYYRVECERALHLPEAVFGRRRRLYRRD